MFVLEWKSIFLVSTRVLLHVKAISTLGEDESNYLGTADLDKRTEWSAVFC